MPLIGGVGMPQVWWRQAMGAETLRSKCCQATMLAAKRRHSHWVDFAMLSCVFETKKYNYPNEMHVTGAAKRLELTAAWRVYVKIIETPHVGILNGKFSREVCILFQMEIAGHFKVRGKQYKRLYLSK